MELNGKQRRALRSQAHHLRPAVIVGDAGMSPAVLARVDQELEDLELIKVKLGKNAGIKAKIAAPHLAEVTGSAVAQVVGGVVTLYRRRADRPEVALPGL